MSKRRIPRKAIGVMVAAVLCGTTAAAVQSQTRQHRPDAGASHSGQGTGKPVPIQGLTPDQLAAFKVGADDFTEVETPETGLGPVFNARSCGECHAQPAVGGASPDLNVARVTRIGRILNGVFDPLTEKGGSLLQARSVKEIDPNIPVDPETVPPEATIVSHRQTPPLFGAGLIEAIPAADIQRRVGNQGDGVAGVANLIKNPETGQMELGRFGWKAQVPTLHLFSGDAYLNELGITSATFPNENLPQGKPIPAGADLVPGIEADAADVESIATFMRFLAPPPPPRFSPGAQQGGKIFQAIGCASCHVPAMRTGNSPVAALRNQLVGLYSDLLLHDMGKDLDDGIVMGNANGRQWRTTPLWGMSQRRFFLHDGRTTTVDQAVLAHGGEGNNSKVRFQQLNPRDRGAVVEFLRSL